MIRGGIPGYPRTWKGSRKKEQWCLEKGRYQATIVGTACEEQLLKVAELIEVHETSHCLEL